MTSRVFISHSTKPAELAPPRPARGKKEQAAWDKADAHRKVFYKLRKAIVAKIKACNHLDPWVDDRDLKTGGKWRNSIHGGLLTADAAILLISPEAKESPWVLKEATVLTVLESAGFPIAIVPVLLGLRSRELETGFWGPLKLREIQGLKVDELVLDATKIGQRADEVVAALIERIQAKQGASLPTTTSAFETWVDKLVDQFGDVSEPVLTPLMNELKLPEATLTPEQLLTALRTQGYQPHPERERKRLLIRELLVGDPVTSVGVMSHNLAGANVDVEKVVRVFKPALVPAASAAAAPAAARDGIRAIVVNAEHPKIGKALVRRALCWQFPQWRLLAPDVPPDDQSTDDVVKHYQAHVAAKLGRQPRRWPEKAAGGVYVVVGHSVARSDDMVDALLGDGSLSPVTFVLMAGSQAEAEQIADRLKARIVCPPLPSFDEPGVEPNADEWFDELENDLESIGYD